MTGGNMEKNNAKVLGENNLFQIINKLKKEEKATLKGITDQAVKPLYDDPRIPNETLNKAKDIMFISVCSAYVYGNKRVFEELEKLK